MLSSLMPRRCWLQFSLRGFLIAISALAIGLGWTTARARRRGLAIDALNEKGRVGYIVQVDDTDDEGSAFDPGNHFWLDVKRVPVHVRLDEYNKAAALQIMDAKPIGELVIKLNDDYENGALDCLKFLNSGCRITFWVAPTSQANRWTGCDG